MMGSHLELALCTLFLPCLSNYLQMQASLAIVLLHGMGVLIEPYRPFLPLTIRHAASRCRTLVRMTPDDVPRMAGQPPAVALL